MEEKVVEKVEEGEVEGGEVERDLFSIIIYYIQYFQKA